MEGLDEPRGGRKEGAGELHAPPLDTAVSERPLSDPDFGRERGFVQGEGGQGWSGDVGRGEFASGGGRRAGY
jgi:hypothetical protein